MVTVSDADITWTATDPVFWAVLEPCLGVTCACIPLMGPLLSRASTEHLAKRANNYREFKDPDVSLNNSRGSNKRRFGNSNILGGGAYPLTSTSGSVGITTNEISSGRQTGSRDSDPGTPMEEFSLGDLDELEAQRACGFKSPCDGIKVKKEWRVQCH